MQENFTFIATGTVCLLCLSFALIFMYFIANYGTATQKTLMKLIADQRAIKAAPASLKALSSWQVVRLQKGIMDILFHQVSLARKEIAELTALEKIRHVEQVESFNGVSLYLDRIEQTEHLKVQFDSMVQGLLNEYEKQGQNTEVSDEVFAETEEALNQYYEI